jgi:hypothetical protein
MPEEKRPAHSSKNVSQVNARDADGDLDRIGLGKLGAEDAKVEVNPVASQEDKRSDRGQSQ